MGLADLILTQLARRLSGFCASWIRSDFTQADPSANTAGSK